MTSGPPDRTPRRRALLGAGGLAALAAGGAALAAGDMAVRAPAGPPAPSAPVPFHGPTRPGS
ncbi:hypothetical protein [Streptomyces sp. AB3(2024)]|uniref:hypothetical protein n=1 Tax=Streptomyces sp. AB3(2024) TaxID=3317321 RepID=UPI0035A2C388